MRKLIIAALTLCLLSISTAIIFFYKHARNQGLSNKELEDYSGALIRRDQRGVIQIKGKSWLDIIQAQGFVAASERMFQMDLMRRKADGALSELFGKSALEYDRQQRQEDWRHYANLASDSLSTSERATCEAYSRGVNRFLDEYRNRAGLEYTMLRSEPAPWSCADTLLIVLLLSDNMSRSWNLDLEMKEWHDAIPAEWWAFMFHQRHPWNKVWFESESLTSVSNDLPKQFLPSTPMTEKDFKISPEGAYRELDGSNSWAYRGKNGAWLASDPHLGYQVPQLWIPIRLETEDGKWVVGTALPGAPGILIGMNSNLAWSITNTGEDVDDAVIESSLDQLTTENREIKIKGEPSQSIQIRKSAKGPVVRDLGDGKVAVRQWIALKPGILNIPIQDLDYASDWESFNRVLDQFKFVPLNFTMLDRSNNMGLRISGCDIIRQNSGDFAEPAEISTWDANCGTERRRRLLIPFDNGVESEFISTANEQLWIDQHLQNWSDDDRAARIREKLSLSSNLTIEDMRLLQLDTTSRFHKELLTWLLKNDTTSYLTSKQKTEWGSWDGNIRTCPLCMSEATDAASLIDQLIIRKVGSHFNKSKRELPYVKRKMERMRIVKIMESPEAVSALGFNAQDLATRALRNVARTDSRKTVPWQERNHWTAQHPFVGRIPLIDKLFKIDAPLQYGAPSTLRSEKPTHGPSTRIIWQPSNPEASSWSFPTGVSGHAFSNHYSDWLNIWQQGGTMTIPVGK